MRRAAAVALAFAGAAPLWVAPATPAQAEPSQCSGVWVVVDFGSLGGVQTECATSYGTGTAALRSAGFAPTLDSAMITRISGLPESPDVNQAYWSYWQAKVTSDGSFAAWSYSSLGANASRPAKGNAEGWRYQSLAEGKVPPGAKPPAGVAPSPTATKTTATPKPSAIPSTTKQPSATSTATGEASATVGPTPSATPTGSASTPTGRPAASTSATPAGIDPAADQQQPVTADPSGSGSPTGLIATGSILLAAAAGGGAWWWRKGRHR